MGKLRKPAFVLLVVLLLTASSFQAQTPSNAQLAKLTGTVLDPSGAVIPDAAVKALKGDTVVKEGKSDSVGNFAIELPPGEYRMEITASDFAPIRQNLRIVPNMPPVRIRMILAALTAEVTVGAGNDTVGIEEEKNLASTTISGEALKDLLSKTGIVPGHVCYVGDDLVDLGVMSRVGFPVAVANAHPEVKSRAAYVTFASGGRGAIREVVELIVKAQGKWDAILSDFTG